MLTVQRETLNPTVVLSGVVGSKAYGLDHDASDVDTLEVFAADPADFLGLMTPPASRVQTSLEADCTSHELGKFLSLVLRCNPTVTELLWLPEELYRMRSQPGEDLIAMAPFLLHRTGVRNAYLGYASQQARRVTREFATAGRQEKAARHVFRLTHTGVSAWHTGRVQVRVADRDACFDFGRRVAGGDTAALTDLMAWAEAQFDSPTPLPELNPKVAAAASDWLIETRLKQLR